MVVSIRKLTAFSCSYFDFVILKLETSSLFLLHLDIHKIDTNAT